MIINRFFTLNELRDLFENNVMPNDIRIDNTIGVNEVSDCAYLIEDNKIRGLTENSLLERFRNVQESIANGKIWMVELEAHQLANVLVDDDFFGEFCNHRGNPYSLTKRIALFFHTNYSYWTENVYFEAFE
jgi:hypothetical protein